MRTHGEVQRYKAKKAEKKKAKIKALKDTAPGMWPAGTPAYLKEAVRDQRCKAWRGTKEGMAALGIPVTFLLGATLTPIQPLWPLGARADGCASTDDTGTGGIPIRNRTAHGATVVP